MLAFIYRESWLTQLLQPKCFSLLGVFFAIAGIANALFVPLCRWRRHSVSANSSHHLDSQIFTISWEEQEPGVFFGLLEYLICVRLTYNKLCPVHIDRLVWKFANHFIMIKKNSSRLGALHCPLGRKRGRWAPDSILSSYLAAWKHPLGTPSAKWIYSLLEKNVC